jgi:hypothetical protein
LARTLNNNTDVEQRSIDAVQSHRLLNAVDTTSRIQCQGKCGFISATYLFILQRLDIGEWIKNTLIFEMIFNRRFYHPRDTAERSIN